MRSSNNFNSVLSKTTCGGSVIPGTKRRQAIAVDLFSIRLKNMLTNSSGEGISSEKDFHF